jgi:twitching motility protein PilT
MTAYIDDVIRDLLGRGVEFSDIHAIPGELVRYRGGAGLIAESGDPLDDADLAEFLSVHAGPRPWDARLSDGGGQFDFATSLDGVRFRCHVHRHGGCGAMALVLRKLDNRIRDLVDIGLPETVLALLQRRSGLVLVTGPTGAGKTTTLASFIDHLNRNVSWKIVTIEDPIEYMHRSRRSMIVQREVGRDVDSFAQGLVASFREDPDCIMIGEIRDRETVETALAAAEAGHLVLATLHTLGAAKSVERIADFFLADEKPVVRGVLASVLAGVVSQVLIPRADGTGRALAYEIVHNVPSVATLIRGGKAHQIGNAVSTAGMPDMQLLNRTLALMVRAGLVARDQALVASYDARELERELVARDTLLGPR